MIVARLLTSNIVAAKLRRSLRHLEILAYTSPSNTAHVYQEDVTVLVIVRHPQSSVSYYLKRELSDIAGHSPSVPFMNELQTF